MNNVREGNGLCTSKTNATLGKFIVFEGVDGCGKTTQVQLLMEYLKSKNIPAILTKVPGGTSIGDKIRGILLDPDNTEMVPRTEMLLYAVSRGQQAFEKIIPTLKSGTTVVCDRYFYSSLAYQGGGRGLNKDIILELHRIATDDLHADLVILIDITVEESTRRLTGRRGVALDRLERETVEFFQRTRAAYLEQAKSPRFNIVNGDDTVANIHNKIKTLIDNLYK